MIPHAIYTTLIVIAITYASGQEIAPPYKPKNEMATPYRPLPPQAAPLKSHRCCARAHQCYRFRLFTPRCRAYVRPICISRRYRRCDQRVILLRRVLVAFSNKTRLCCRVISCPRIYYSKCSYCTDRCSAYQRACTPYIYKRHRLRVYCPRIRVRYVFRYLPHCCVCRYCPLVYNPILPRRRG